MRLGCWIGRFNAGGVGKGWGASGEEGKVVRVGGS